MNSKLWIHTHAPLYHSPWSSAQGAGCCSPTANQPCLELSCFHLNGCKVGRWWGYRHTPSDCLKKQTHYILLFWVQHFGKHSYSHDANQGLRSESPVNYQPMTRTLSLSTRGVLQDMMLRCLMCWQWEQAVICVYQYHFYVYIVNIRLKQRDN